MAKKPIKPKIVRAPRAAQSAPRVDSTTQASTALYEVLTPFKFRGVILKPPTWIELTEREALPYQEDGVLGTEPADVPDPNSDVASTSDSSGENPADAATT